MTTAFGDLLRQFRVAASLTQEALAQRCAISPATIAAIERGRRKAPRLSTVGRIADALGLDSSDRALLATVAQAGSLAGLERGEKFAAIRPAGRDVDAQAPAPWQRPGRPATLPSPLTPLFGRHSETDALAHTLASERLVSLVGPGGVGKTRLALAVAAATLDKFAGGTFWAELGPVVDPGVVPQAVLRSFGASEQPGVPIGEQVLAALPTDRVLLVVDNCEHVLDAAASAVSGLLAHPSLSVLATSREPLAIPGEIRWQVSALAVPTPEMTGTAAEMIEIDSVKLFVERATRVNPSFTLGDTESVPVARICRRLEGMPLAIELAAARTNSLPLRKMAEELEERVPLTYVAARGVPLRQSTLWASIDWSYRLLTEQEQRAFRCLAAFTGSFTSEAFEAIVTKVRSAPRETSTLSRLVDKCLVSVDPRTGRCRLLETIRSFVVELANEALELDAIQQAHAEFYLSWLTELKTSDANDQVLDLVATEYPNIRAALVSLIAARSPRAATLVAAIGLAWHQRSLFYDARLLGDGALEVGSNDPRAWAAAAASLGSARLLGGDPAFRSVLAEAESVAKGAGDNFTEGWCRFVQGHGAPYDVTHLMAAYELGVESESAALAGVAAAALASGGTDNEREKWLRRAGESIGRISNSTLWATYEVARADSLSERGRMQEALAAAVYAACDPAVTPTVRYLALGRSLQVALLRRDVGVAERVSDVGDELDRLWPAGGAWETSTWSVYGDLLRLWAALLYGESPRPFDPQQLRYLTRTAVTPSVVRSVCRAALDRGERVDAAAAAHSGTPAAAGSLMQVSLTAIDAASASLHGDDALAESLWRTVLDVAKSNDYLVLVCDALEALGCIASRRNDTTRAAALILAARGCRRQISYHFHFAFEQRQLDEALTGVDATSPPQRVISWQAAVEEALAT